MDLLVGWIGGVMGIRHGFKKDAIRDAYLAGYRLVSDLKVAPENRGLLGFTSDHIALDFLNRIKPTEKK